MDEDLIRSLTATLLDVFPELRVYRPDPNTVVFLASDQPLELETRLAATGLPLRDAPLHYARFGINNAEDLATALALDTDGAKRMAVGARLITDDDNRIATSSVFEQERGMTGTGTGQVLAGYDPWQRKDSVIYEGLRERLSFPYMIRRNGVFVLIDASVADRLAHMSQILGNTADGDYARAFYYRMKRQGDRSNQLLRLSIDQYPDYPPLRQEFLRDSFGALARGDAPPEIVEVAAALRGPPADLLVATQHAARGEWLEVARADQRLAEIPWTDAWYPEALELRINWRTRVNNPEQMRRFGDESISMIDRMIIMNPTLTLYGMRARAGFASQRPGIVVESVFNYARLASHMARAGAVTAEAMRHDAMQLRQVLSDAEKMPGVDAARAAEVRAELDTLMPIS